MDIPQIRIADYTYDLPQERIATYPLSERDASNLLVYKDGVIGQKRFYELPELLPECSVMVFNDTKVVPARLLFTKSTGALIEIFCLEPVSPPEYARNFDSVGSCSWRCIVGNAKKWKEGSLDIYVPEGQTLGFKLQAFMEEREANSFIVKFVWDGGLSFSEVLESCGHVPIPPYLGRDTEQIDLERYQTLYARFRGSVAAPTAGLHFTQRVLDRLDERGIGRHTVCLHVGAGTFLPVKSEYIEGHTMHSEPFVVTRELLCAIAGKPEGAPVVSVGTTSTRTLESLYFLGVRCLEAGPRNWEPSPVEQWEPYGREYKYTLRQSFDALIQYLDYKCLSELKCRTRIIIVPGYSFKVVDIQITNFHQPQSTLLLLIGAIVGEDWRRIYDYAMDKGFRFLSYGDSSLLWKKKD